MPDPAGTDRTDLHTHVAALTKGQHVHADFHHDGPFTVDAVLTENRSGDLCAGDWVVRTRNGATSLLLRAIRTVD